MFDTDEAKRLADAADRALEPNWPANVDPLARHGYRVTYDYYGADGAWFEYEGTWRGLVNVLGILGGVKKLELYRHFSLAPLPAEEEIPSVPALAASLRDAVAEIKRLTAQYADCCEVLTATQHVVDEQRAEIERLREALKPFAAYRGSDEYLKSAEDDGLCAATSFTAGAYRKARLALGDTHDNG